MNNLPSIINVSDYSIKDFDKYNCTHRIRFNIMNVKADRNIYNNNTELSSLEIIYLINQNNEKIKYGVFDINSYKEKIQKDFTFDSDIVQFSERFYNNYDKKNIDPDYAEYYYNYYTKEIKGNNKYSKIMDKSNMYITNYTRKSLNNYYSFLFFRNYYFYLYFGILNDQNNWYSFGFYLYLVAQIEKLNSEYYDKIRILTDYISNISKYKLFPNFINIKKLDKQHPYYLAIQLQKNIISNINEKSNIFYPIIQLNSKILKL